MLAAKLLKQMARRVGVHIERLPNKETSWNHDILFNFPVDLRSRWGYGLPHNPHLYALLDAQRSNYGRALDDIKSARSVLSQIPFDEDDPKAPFWNNHWFMGLDAAALVGFLVCRQPRTYLEIGSGFSTRFSRRAITAAATDTRTHIHRPRSSYRNR